MFVEALESRTLLTVSAVNAQVATDRLEIKADLLKFKADANIYTAKLLTDVAAIKADDPGQSALLAPLFKTLHTDVLTMRTQLAADRLAEGQAVLADESVIVAELKQIAADKGNATALTADRAQLLADRIQLQNDEIAGLNARINTRTAAYTTIFSDVQAITTAVQNDTGASPKLVKDVTKFTTDRTKCLDAMLTDLNTIEAGRTKLVADLTALQNQ